MKAHARLCGIGSAVAFIVIAPPVSAEVWNCQLQNHSGFWQTDGSDLVVPSAAGARRMTIASDTIDSVVAMNGGGRHIEIAVIDRRRLQARFQVIDLDGFSEQREMGGCAPPNRRTAAQASEAAASVRHRVRKLVAEAHSLADQGFATAANLKLIEAQDLDRITPQELALISDMRTYVAAKPRR